MLYVTTRGKFDAYTAPRTLQADRGPDGGLFLPFRMPRFSEEQLAGLKDRTIGQCIADTLNIFFSCQLSEWALELTVGRYPVKLRPMTRSIVAGEFWHNTDDCYQRLERALLEQIAANAPVEVVSSSWVRIAIRISVLFAAYGELLRSGAVSDSQKFDIAMPALDFSGAMAAWYAREMGMPIANIICGCNENSALWELFHMGEVRTDSPVTATETPEADLPLPEELERLVFGTLGVEEALRFADACQRGGLYALEAEQLERLRAGMFAAVVSGSRLEAAVPSVYSTGGCIVGPYTALGYSALLDYRARTGTRRPALLVADRHPVCDGPLVARMMNIPIEELLKKLDRT